MKKFGIFISFVLIAIPVLITMEILLRAGNARLWKWLKREWRDWNELVFENRV